MGYYAGEVISGRCEDFPCCGHTDGDPCPRPHEVRGTLAHALYVAEQKWYEEQEQVTRRRTYDETPDTCESYFADHADEELCDYRIFEGDVRPECEQAYDEAEGFTYTTLTAMLIPFSRAVIYCGHCKDCIAEAEDAEREGMERQRDYE
jgi:hypothetical protein